MAKYDAIIIGGGNGGLSVGALLANSGRKVLVLEKDDHLGGRAFSATHKGHIVDNGVHGVLMALGNIQEVFSRLNKPMPKQETLGKAGFKILHEGKWQDLRDIFPRKEYRELLSKHIVPLSYEEIKNSYDDVSLPDWLSSRTDNEGLHLFFSFLGWLLGVGGNRIDCISAGAMMYYLKEQLEKSGGLGDIAGYWRGGVSELTNALADAMKEKGGELKRNAKVSNIVIEKGVVRGVEVETEERVIPDQVLTTEFIEAPIVVNTLPIWDLFSVVSPEEFPVWYVDWVKEIGEKVAYCVGIRYSLDKPIVEEYKSLWWGKSPTGGLMNTAAMMHYPEYYQGTGGVAADFWQQWQWFEVPPNFRSGNRVVSHEARKLLHVFEKDIQALFPDIEKLSKGKFYYAGIYGLVDAPWTVGTCRPGIQPPAVRNLYLSSDTLREGRIGGTSAISRCALNCVDMILKVNDK